MRNETRTLDLSVRRFLAEFRCCAAKTFLVAFSVCLHRLGVKARPQRDVDNAWGGPVMDKRLRLGTLAALISMGFVAAIVLGMI